MNRNATLIIFIVVIVGAIGTFVYYQKKYIPKYQWGMDFRKSSEQPYGLKLFYNYIKGQQDPTTLLYNQSYHLLDTTVSNGNFIFIGDYFGRDSESAESILKFVEKGNCALIASNSAPLEILRNFVPIGDTISGFSIDNSSKVRINFQTKNIPYPGPLKFHHQVLKDTVENEWSVYNKRYFDDTLVTYHFIPFSALNDTGINAFYFQHGKGRFIIHANPQLFTNFYMVNRDGYAHANNFLSLLHKGPTFWDDPYTYESTNSQVARKNPLKFLFSDDHLKYGWYLFLLTVILYLLFRSKREQRVIPLMPVNTNASIEYTKAIGTLYFQSKGHNHIANEMYITFLSEIRSRYNISTDISENELIEQLFMRSGIEKTVLFNLFKQFKYVRSNQEATGDDLITLHNAIEYYHKKRK